MLDAADKFETVFVIGGKYDARHMQRILAEFGIEENVTIDSTESMEDEDRQCPFCFRYELLHLCILCSIWLSSVVFSPTHALSARENWNGRHIFKGKKASGSNG